MNDKKRLKRIWRDFESSGMCKELETHPEKHTFEFSVGIGVGWEYVDYVVNGKKAGSCRVSYIGPDVSKFVDCVRNLGDGDTEYFIWYDEPGEYQWLLSRNGEYIYIEAPGIKGGFFLDYDYFVAQLWDC